MSTKVRFPLLQTLGIPPIATGLILSVFLLWNLASDARPVASPEYLTSVRERVQEIPYSIGPLVGIDLEVVAAAAMMLNPNVILQRVYRDPLLGHSVSLVVVHCQDVRDLAGHYPPICYPNAGWENVANPSTFNFDVDDSAILATRYAFERRGDLSSESLKVVSFFAMPATSAQFSPDIKAVDIASRSPRTAGLGAAHIMLVVPASQPDDVSQHLIKDVLRALRPTLQAICKASPQSAQEPTP